MNAQLERTLTESHKMDLEIDRLRQDLKWEPYKAFAAVLAGVAAMSGVIIAVAHFVRP